MNALAPIRVYFERSRKQSHTSRLLINLEAAQLPGQVELPPVERLICVHAMLPGKRCN
jgi:hypothetical protein